MALTSAQPLVSTGTAAAKTPDTALVQGALLYRNASDMVSLPPGTAGQVLQTNGAGANPSWASAGSLVQLSQQTASGGESSIDFESGIDGTYANYVFTLSEVRPTTNAVELYIRVQTSSTWRTSSYAYVIMHPSSGAAYDDSRSNSTVAIRSGFTLSSTSTRFLSGEVWLFNPAGTATRKPITLTGYGVDASGNRRAYHGGGDYYGDTAAVTGIRFLFSSGTVAGGVFTIYGQRG